MEVAVGALAGAGAGAITTLATTYFQMRMNRKEQDRLREADQRTNRHDQIVARSRARMERTWQVTHDTAHILTALEREGHDVLHESFTGPLDNISFALLAQAIVMSSEDEGFKDRIFKLGHILHHLPLDGQTHTGRRCDPAWPRELVRVLGPRHRAAAAEQLGAVAGEAASEPLGSAGAGQLVEQRC